MAEGESVPVEGWDFSWLAGRATEQRPSWGYARTLVDRLGDVGAVLDVQTGGGEVLAEMLAQLPQPPIDLAATEAWPPNIDIARRNLQPFGVSVAQVADDAALPFPSDSFDMVASRHPTVVMWPEIARVLRPGGSYLSQQVGPGSNRELTDFLMGPQPVNPRRSAARAAGEALAAGLGVVELREEALAVELNDIRAVIYFLRKVLWTVPNFTVERYRKPLERLHDRIVRDGPFVAYAQRFLIEAHKPCSNA